MSTSNPCHKYPKADSGHQFTLPRLWIMLLTGFHLGIDNLIHRCSPISSVENCCCMCLATHSNHEVAPNRARHYGSWDKHCCKFIVLPAPVGWCQHALLDSKLSSEATGQWGNPDVLWPTVLPEIVLTFSLKGTTNVIAGFIIRDLDCWPKPHSCHFKSTFAFTFQCCWCTSNVRQVMTGTERKW